MEKSFQSLKKNRIEPLDLKSFFGRMSSGFVLQEIILNKAGEPVDTRFLAMNKVYEKMWGVKASEVIGKTGRQIHAPHDKTLFQTFVKVATTGKTNRIEYFHKELQRTFDLEIFCPKKGMFATIFNDITERKQMQEQLVKLNECLSNLGPDALENINRLTALGGELLEADCALYNRLDQRMLCSWGQWHTPPGYNPQDNPEGHICYDVIKRGSEQLFIVRHLPETSYAQSDPNVAPYHLQTYIGQAVKFGNQFVGSLCLVYQRDFIPSKAQKRLVGIIASAIAVEEKRKQAEEALLENEGNYRLLVDNSPDNIVRFDLAGRLLLVNHPVREGLEMLLGGKEEKYIGKTYRELGFPEEQCKFWAECRQKVIDTGLPFSIEYTFEIFGDKRYFEWRLFPELDKDGRTVTVLALSRDITERKRAEQAMAESEIKFKWLYEYAPSAYHLLTPDGTLTDVNHRWCELLGHRREDVLGRAIFDFVVEEERELAKASFEKKKQSRQLYTEGSERNFKTKDGTVRTFKTYDFFVLDQRQNITSVQTTIEDITERKQAEEAQKLANIRYKSLFEQTQEAIFIMNIRGHILDVNRRAAEMMGYTVEELRQLSFSSVSTQIPESKQILKKILAGEKINLYERIFRKKDGTLIPVELNVELVKDPKGKPLHILSVGRDITQRKTTEKALRENESSLQGILQSTADGILAVNTENKVLFANERFVEMWRIPRAVMASKEDSILLQHVLDQLSDPQGFLRKVQYLYRSKERSFDTLNFKNGRVFERLSRPLMQYGELRGRVWSFRDITERKQAKENLRKSEESFHNLFENSTVGLYRTTPDGEFLLANPTLVHMLGYESFEELAKRNLERDGFEPGYKREEFKRLVENDTFVQGLEIVWQKKDGTNIYVRESAKAIRDASGKIQYYEGTVEDITERKKAEEKFERNTQVLKACNEELERFNKVAVGRELRMIELKKKINELSSQLGKKPPYLVTTSDGSAQQKKVKKGTGI